jgi:hypothetical protein
VSTRRVVQSVGTILLAALVVLGAAGTASAAFSAKTATSKVTASTLKLEPPTGLIATCKKTGNNYVPTVTFTRSVSIGVVAEHPQRDPAQVFGYLASLTVNGDADPNGYSLLDDQATKWTGASHQGTRSSQLRIVTYYGYWSSDIATVNFQC